MITNKYMRSLLLRCVEEDGGLDGDITTNSLNLYNETGRFAINVRGNGTVAGLEPIAEAIDLFGDVSMTLLLNDGDEAYDENIAILEGSVRAILVAERTILNVICHASGVATQTKKFVDKVAGTGCAICDTRKTTPGLRLLDKYAVVCGGGTSHRMGLHDAALYKDNHLSELGDLTKELGAAIVCVKENNELKFVEVEVDSLNQLEKVLLLPVDIILLDNMPPELLRQAVELRDASGSSPLLEASGGVTLDTVREIAETGVDRISIGGLVHQAVWIDVGLDAVDA
tara:strand:- start:523 stop:1377 length:855 start_codon:yes stop_codon:yes gene_type:complete